MVQMPQTVPEYHPVIAQPLRMFIDSNFAFSAQRVRAAAWTNSHSKRRT